MPRSDPHSDCLRCLGESHVSVRCKICRSFKPRTKKDRDIRLRALLMESALAPTPVRRAESAPGTLSSVRGDPPAPSSGRHRSPSCRQRKAPSAHCRRDKDKGEARPVCGSPNSPPGPIALTHAERSSPVSSAQASPDARMPSTPEAFQAAKDLLTLQVPAVPAPGVLSRGKLPLGSRPSTPTRRGSRSRDRSRVRSPLSTRSDHSPQPPQSPMVRLSGEVLPDQSSGHRSRLSRESRHSRHRRRRCSQLSQSYCSCSRHGRRRSRSSSRSSRHREHDSRKRSPTPHRRGHRHHSVSRSSSSRRYHSSSLESRSRGRRHCRRRRSYSSHGIDRMAFTPAVSHSRASAFQPDQLVPLVPQQGQWQGVPWQGQWCQWTPWPPGHAQPDTRSVAGASGAPSATISRAPRHRSADQGSSAPNADSEQGVEPTVPADALSSVPVSSPVPEDKVAAPPPSVPQEDYRAHQELLKRVASNLQLQAEEMEGPSDSHFSVLSSSAPGRVALPLHEGVANITKALWHTPASLAPISRKAERKYFVPTKGHEFLYTHPAPNSLVVESVNHRERQGQLGPTPKNKDSKRLDSFGRTFYSSSSFQLRVANHQALLSRYDFNLWGSLQKFEPSLPEPDHKEFKALAEEGAATAKAALQAASDAADTAA
ncbi:uncharacterized protein RBU57_012234 [Macrochelys suwanniensis]